MLCSARHRWQQCMPLKALSLLCSSWKVQTDLSITCFMFRKLFWAGRATSLISAYLRSMTHYMGTSLPTLQARTSSRSCPLESSDGLLISILDTWSSGMVIYVRSNLTCPAIFPGSLVTINYMSAIPTLVFVSVAICLKAHKRGTTVQPGGLGPSSAPLIRQPIIIWVSTSARCTPSPIGCPALIWILLVLRILNHHIKSIRVLRIVVYGGWVNT